jgi:hypothetical protein
MMLEESIWNGMLVHSVSLDSSQSSKTSEISLERVQQVGHDLPS